MCLTNADIYFTIQMQNNNTTTTATTTTTTTINATTAAAAADNYTCMYMYLLIRSENYNKINKQVQTHTCIE